MYRKHGEPPTSGTSKIANAEPAPQLTGAAIVASIASNGKEVVPLAAVSVRNLDERVKERFAQKVGASGGASDPGAISHRGHMLQLSDFVAAIRENRTPKVDGREGRKAVATICAVYESARTGKAVELR